MGLMQSNGVLGRWCRNSDTEAERQLYIRPNGKHPFSGIGNSFLRRFQ